MIKKTLVWQPKSIFGCKEGKRYWKRLRKIKSKKEMRDALFELAWKAEALEDRLIELKKLVGDKREY